MPKLRQTYCHHCRCDRHFRKRDLDHPTHLAATVFTFGLWSIGWLALTIKHLRKPWRCSSCGNRLRTAPGKPATSAQRASAGVPQPLS